MTVNYNRIRNWITPLLLLAVLTVSSRLLAGVSFTLSGKQESHHFGFVTEKSGSGSGTVEFDIGSVVRLGYTYQHEVSRRDGYLQQDPNDEDSLYSVYFLDREVQQVHSGDLTLILYSGDTFVPYIFGGLQHRTAKIQRTTAAGTADLSPHPELKPTGGIGFGLRLSQNLMLKFSNRWIPSEHYFPGPDGKPAGEAVVDSEQQIGLTFRP
jgi:hypothetical protein